MLIAPSQLEPTQLARLRCSNTLASRFSSKRETARSLLIRKPFMKPGSKSHETHVQVILTKATNVGFVCYLKNQPRPGKEAIIDFRQLRKKNEWKKNVTSTKARVVFVIARWDFQSFQSCSFLFPKNTRCHGKLTLNNYCVLKRFF